MQYRTLGRSGLIVSRLCFGSLTIGPLQANLSLEAGAGVIRRALELGINFIDTAQSYLTYPYIARALEGWPQEVIIASKSYAYNAKDMAAALEEARKALNRDVIDIFLLHEQESPLTIIGHREALDYLVEAKARGRVRAVGLSSHAVAAVRAAALMPEIDVIHPLLNMRGLGILDGSAEDMLEAIEAAYEQGKGIYAMKPLGGGHLKDRAREALQYVLDRQAIHAVAVGMQSAEEVEVNVAWATGRKPAARSMAALNRKPRRLLVEEWCMGCGNCVSRCPQGALKMEEGRVRVDRNKCILCGYCAAACRDFCLKVI